jgi:hypothetical protein
MSYIITNLIYVLVSSQNTSKMSRNKMNNFACRKEREQPTHLDDKRSLLDMDSFT